MAKKTRKRAMDAARNKRPLGRETTPARTGRAATGAARTRAASAAALAGAATSAGAAPSAGAGPAQRPFRILSIDGGGIRGILPARLLVGVEQMLAEATANPSARIADHFDLIAGTSTGGILACVYVAPDPRRAGRARYAAADALDFYIRHGQAVFDPGLFDDGGLLDERYKHGPLEALLKQYLGDARLSQAVRPCLMTAYDITERRSVFFTSHDAADPKWDYLLRAVARATSAAPTFFEAALTESLNAQKRPLVDGGLFANNPAMCAFAEAPKIPPPPGRSAAVAGPRDLAILSLGTGRHARPYAYDEAKDWGLVSWARPVIDIMMTASAETVDYQLTGLFAGAGVASQYLRIEPALGDAQPDLDDARPGNIAALARAGEAAYRAHEADLRRFVTTHLV